MGVRFSAEHRREELRDKAGRAAVKVVEVKEKVLPALDDDFAKQVGEFDTLDAVRAELRRQLEARRDRDDKLRPGGQDRRGRCWRATSSPCPTPWCCARCSTTWSTRASGCAGRASIPTACRWDYQKLVADLRPGAAEAVRRTLLLEAIAEAEQVAPTEAEVDAEIEKLAAASRRPAPAVRRMMEKGGDLDASARGLREQQTLDLLIRHATVHP